ncbi:DUF2867 domain-containing protein [Ottowia testudinis]|uniref:DUF2867 domain-containing protein n=2 Tax=Ottowia testudinis TaxID=2816950 RepID=A0A975CJF8_9BURK|nr:DUF2867 domain-containing protein [Ottowia testudinis]
MVPQEVAVPEQSVLQSSLRDAHFYDAYSVSDPHADRSALQIWLETVSRTPAWVETAMTLRNAVVARLGLKHLGGLSDFSATKPAASYAVGDRVGIFTIRHLSDQEIVLGDDDKHLHVRLSLFKDAAQERVVVSTVVHIHNLLGHAYMFFVKPMHRIIAPSVLAKIKG